MTKSHQFLKYWEEFKQGSTKTSWSKHPVDCDILVVVLCSPKVLCYVFSWIRLLDSCLVYLGSETDFFKQTNLFHTLPSVYTHKFYTTTETQFVTLRQRGVDKFMEENSMTGYML